MLFSIDICGIDREFLFYQLGGKKGANFFKIIIFLHFLLNACIIKASKNNYK
jgi:hypothetical protein